MNLVKVSHGSWWHLDGKHRNFKQRNVFNLIGILMVTLNKLSCKWTGSKVKNIYSVMLSFTRFYTDGENSYGCYGFRNTTPSHPSICSIHLIVIQSKSGSQECLWKQWMCENQDYPQDTHHSLTHQSNLKSAVKPIYLNCERTLKHKNDFLCN